VTEQEALTMALLLLLLLLGPSVIEGLPLLLKPAAAAS
jgi:hypothetical protein